MDVPILGKTIRLADFPSVAVAIGPVLTFHKRRVDLVAAAGLLQRGLHAVRLAEHDAKIDFPHASLHASFVNRGILQAALQVGNKGIGGVPVSRWVAE